MKTNTLLSPFILFFLLLLPLLSFSQVGINTTSPAPGSILDVESNDKGMLVPRVDIADLNTIAPVTGGSTESLLVYNTNTTTGKGFYYWDGTRWVNLEETEKWDLLGNIGTDQDVNFVGTTDGEALTFRTNNVQRFRVANGNQVLAMANGTRIRPFYSWNAETSLGFWRPGTSQMNLSIQGYDFFNANANIGGGSDLEWTFNPVGDDMNLRIETDNNENTLFVDGTYDNVGLGTDTPQGALDVKSSSAGIVFPNVALTASNVGAPVSNPRTGGDPVPGTFVYNTTTTSNGTNDVYPGLYVWDGSEWVPQFTKEDSALFTQSPSGPNGLRPTNDVALDIPGIDGETFTPNYSGVYKIELSVNYGSGQMKDPSSGDINIASQEGQFTFQFNGTDYPIYVNSYGAKNLSIGSSGGTTYYAIWDQWSMKVYVDLVAGTSYTMNLFFEQYENTVFLNNGDSGDGRGHIGVSVHLPCYAEFTYVGE
ncbi:hypothetical protein MG296_01320 [Flavobacteriaceae bacterium TK19130]|nr:hypothetical protein [Thermobacterium salinum]